MNKKIEDLSRLVYEQDFVSLKSELVNIDFDIKQFNESGHTLLHIASKIEDSIDIIKLLVEKGIDVNIVDDNGRTPLFEAVNYECPNNLKLLLELGGDPKKHNHEKQTPLMIACAGDNFECVRILLENGVEADNTVTKETPLNSAVYAEASMELIEYLLGKGADINAGDGRGTPLMSAISNENLDMVKYLIGKGAKIKEIKDVNGDDALEFALKVENEKIIEYLKSQL